MTNISVGRPAALNRFVKDDHLGHNVMFIKPQLEKMSTTFGEGEAAICDVICVTEGVGWLGQAIFGSALVPRLCGSTDDVVVGLLVQGKSQPGKNPPWLLDDPNDVELAAAQKLANRVISRLGSGKLVVDLDSLVPSEQEPEF